MNKIKKRVPIFILGYIILNYIWIVSWKGNENVFMFVNEFFQISAPVIALFWLFNTFINAPKRNQIFWLLLSLGCLTNVIGQGIWLYFVLFLGNTATFPLWADYVWLIEYVFYFFAFLLRLYILRHSYSPIPFFIDLGTVMVVTLSLIWNFYIYPLSTQLTSNSLFITYMGYPIGSFIEIFGAVSLFLVWDKNNFSKNVLFPMILGFLLKACADAAYAYLVINQSYSMGSYLDPLWSLAILLIGVAGLNAKSKINQSSNQLALYQYRHFLPYFAVSILLVFSILKHYQIMEALTYGLATTIILLLIRLTLSLLRNWKLLHSHEQLSKDLTRKNIELKKLNQALSEKEQQLKDVFNNLDAVIWSFDFQTKTSVMSKGAERVFGHSQKEFLENPRLIMELVHPDDLGKINLEGPATLSNLKNHPLIEFRLRLPNNKIKWISALRTPIFDELGNLIKVNAVVTDITEQKRAEEKIESMAYYDELTGLPNRHLFYIRLKQAMDRANFHHNKVAVMFIDLDRFKSVNDTLGHQFGDFLLQGVSNRLKVCVNDNGTVCRIGGDEFTIILPLKTYNESKEIAKKIIEELGKPIFIEGHELFITPSIGISFFPDHGETEEELIKKADMAMYHAKDRGKNNYSIYTSELDRINARNMQVENALRKAIARNELSLYYQPKIEIMTGKIVGMEALTRWHHPKMGTISPMEFIPLAEETGLIDQIGNWVLKTACQQNKNWQVMGLPAIPISVNVSACQLNKKFVAVVSQVLQETQLDAKYLELEITESVMQVIEDTCDVLHQLKKLGLNLSLDDFGTGYSSLSYLRHLPVDCVKIDKSFIRDIVTRPNDGVIVKTIIDMARNLNFNVIAEGIENEEQNLFLIQNNCFLGQGFYYSPPVPADKFLPLLKKEFLKR